MKLQLWRERGNACRGPTVPVTPAHSRMGGRATVTASHVLLPPHPLRPKPPSKTEAAREASQPTMSSDAKDMCGRLAGGPWTASAAHGEPASLLWRWTSPAQDPAVSLRSLEPRGSQSWTGSTGSPSDCRLTNEQDCALAGEGKATVTVTACILVTQSPAGRGVMPRDCVQTPSASGKWAESAGGGGKRRRVRPPPHGPGTAALGNGRTSFRTHEALVRCKLADTLLDRPHLAPCRGLDQSRSQPTATWNTALPEWERSLLKVFVKAVPSPLTSRDKLIKLRATGKCYLAMPLPWAAARCRGLHRHGLLHAELVLPGSPLRAWTFQRCVLNFSEPLFPHR